MAQNHQNSAVAQLLNEQTMGDSRQTKRQERRKLITEAIIAEGSIRIDDLVERFGISLMTAHRDLDELENLGLLRKARGVVTAAPTSVVDASNIYRSKQQSEEKTAIAQAACRLIEPGKAIFLDNSTTVLHMVPYLNDVTPISVITNSLTLMNELKGKPDLSIIGLGGEYHDWSDAFTGSLTRKSIAQMHADMAFLSMASIQNDMVFHPSPETIETQMAMFESATTRILLADHTKFSRTALHSFMPLSAFDIVIVDDGLARADIERMQNKGINVVVATVKTGS